MDLTPAMVQAAKACGEHEPEFYIVECARRDQALTVADYFGSSDNDDEFIKEIQPIRFPIRVGRLSDDKFIVLYEGDDTKLSMHHDTIAFKNWIVIRSQDHIEVFDLYKKLGMDT